MQPVREALRYSYHWIPFSILYNYYNNLFLKMQGCF